MNFALTPEQEMLRDAARAYLADKVPMARVRQIMETPEGFDRDVWSETAQMGWHGMAIPEAYGGAGYSFVELGIVLEELGRAVTPLPFLSTVVLAAGAVELAGDEEQKAAYLPSFASGELIGALALVESDGRWMPDPPEVSATPSGSGFVLSGTKHHVLDGHVADLLVVLATSPDGPDLFVVPGDAPGVSRTKVVTMDQTRCQASVTFDDVEVPATARLGSPGSAIETLDRLLDRVAVAVAFEQVGGAQRCLEMSVAYAKERYQFGRPIGSFQAIKHMCADMLVEVEAARSAAYYAGWAVAGDEDELRIVAPVAKSYCSDAYFKIAGDTIQVHGGIGFTWEHDAHLYFKRAKTDELLFGGPAEWRAKLADRLGL